MSLTHITTHAALALARLATQYRNKSRIAGLFNAVTAQVQEIEDALYQLATERTLAVAVGTQLDMLGAVLDEPRGPATDGAYRLILQAKIRVNKSSGTTEDLVSVFYALFPTSLITVATWAIAYVTVEIDATITAAEAVLYRRFLRTARAGGVAGTLLWREAAAASCFTLSDAANYPEAGGATGLGDATDASVGGVLTGAGG